MLMLLALVACSNDEPDFNDIKAVEPGETEEVEVEETEADDSSWYDPASDLWDWVWGDDDLTVVEVEDEDSGSGDIDFDEPLPVACLGTTADMLEATSPYPYGGTQYMTIYGSTSWTETDGDGNEIRLYMENGDEMQLRLHDVTCDSNDNVAIVTDDGLVEYDGRCLAAYIGYVDELNLDCEAEIEVTECEPATVTLVTTTTVNGEIIKEMRHVERCDLLNEWPEYEAPCED